MSSGELAAQLVAAELDDPESRGEALDALEAAAEAGSVELATAVASAPVLARLLGRPLAEVDAQTFRRAALLVVRLVVEARTDDGSYPGGLGDRNWAQGPGRVCSAVLGSDAANTPFAALFASEQNATGASLRGPVESLGPEDALTYACSHALLGHTFCRGPEQIWLDAGCPSFMPHVQMWLKVEPCMSGASELRGHMAQLLLELIRAPEKLPKYALGGAFYALQCCTWGTKGTGCAAQRAFENGLFEVGIQVIRAAGNVEEWTSLSRDKHNWIAGMILYNSQDPLTMANDAVPAARAAYISSGWFDLCISAVASAESRGLERLLYDTDHAALQYAFSNLKFLWQEEGCEAKVRSVASAIAFCMENPLQFNKTFGHNTGFAAGLLAAAVFGRDEEGSEMVFTQKHIDDMIVNWEEIMRPQSFGHYSSLGPESLVALQLSVSDANKPLLLANPGFIPHCIDSLLLDPEHPRMGAAEDKKIFVQEMCKCSCCLSSSFAPHKKWLHRCRVPRTAGAVAGRSGGAAARRQRRRRTAGGAGPGAVRSEQGDRGQCAPQPERRATTCAFGGRGRAHHDVIPMGCAAGDQTIGSEPAAPRILCLARHRAGKNSQR